MLTVLCAAPIIAGIHLCLATLVTGGLFIESFPRQPQKKDHVTLRCYAVPAKIRLLRGCRYQWEMTPREDERNKDEPRMQTRKPASGARNLDPVTHIDAYDSGSVISIDELSEEHEGRYNCRLLCVGRRTESASVDLEIGRETESDAKTQNTRIGYVFCGVVFVVIVLATALRLSCSTESRCPSSSSRPNSRGRWRNTATASRNETAHLDLSWVENLSTASGSSSSSIRYKPKEPQKRPTILVNTVWLPPYEAAVKYSRILNSSSSYSSSSPEQRLAYASTSPPPPPTYDEALVLLRQGSTPDHGDLLPPSSSSSPSEEANMERRIISTACNDERERLPNE